MLRLRFLGLAWRARTPPGAIYLPWLKTFWSKRLLSRGLSPILDHRHSCIQPGCGNVESIFWDCGPHTRASPHLPPGQVRWNVSGVREPKNVRLPGTPQGRGVAAGRTAVRLTRRFCRALGLSGWPSRGQTRRLPGWPFWQPPVCQGGQEHTSWGQMRRLPG